MINLDNFSLADILPSSLLLTDEDKAIAAALTEILVYMYQQSRILDPLNDIPETLLDIVAWGEHVDFYDPSLSVEQKRSLISRSEFFHKQKGTPAAIEELISIVFGEGIVSEWFEYGGERYRFKVITNNRSVTNELADQFISAVNSVKNKRSVLESVEISMSEDMNLYFAGGVQVRDKLTIKQVM